MNLYLVGAQRTGKSTLAKMISEQYHLEYIETKIGDLIKSHGFTTESHLNSNETEDHTNQLRIQELILEYISETFKDRDNFVTDRCELDVFGYSYYLYHKTNDKRFHDLSIECLKRFEKRHGATPVLCQVNPFIPFEYDPKSGDRLSQSMVAEILHFVFKTGNWIVIPREVALPNDRIVWLNENLENFSKLAKNLATK